MIFRLFSMSLVAFAMSTSLLSAQERIGYREFALRSDIESVAKLAGIASTGAKVVHERPVVMQQLEWRPRYSAANAQAQTDPVDLVLFDFYDNQLFKVTVEYAARRVEGLTVSDMVEAISAVYGPSTKVLPTTSPAPVPYGGTETTVATWGDAGYSASLLRVAYPDSFKLVIRLTELDDLARVASAQAGRLDRAEAPRRELERQQKAAAEALEAQKKAGATNKAAFRP
jgi:hypothetical protein